jgi:hypothetical protein
MTPYQSNVLQSFGAGFVFAFGIWMMAYSFSLHTPTACVDPVTPPLSRMQGIGQ